MPLRASRSILETSAVAAWLAQTYGAHPNVRPGHSGTTPGQCTFLSLGLNDHYLWTADNGARYVLRVYRYGWRTKVQAAAECEFIAFLRSRGVATAAPLPTLTGDLVTELDTPEGLRAAALFEYAQGREPTTDDVEAYAEMAAKLHDAADDHPLDPRRPAAGLSELLDRPLTVTQQMYAGRPDDAAYLTELAQRIRATLNAMPTSSLSWGWNHNDLHGGNAHVDGDTVRPFDFDLCGAGFRSYELATYRWGVRMTRPADTESWPRFIDAYTAHRSLSDLDRRAIDVFVLARHLWWMALQVDCVTWAGTAALNTRFLDGAVAGLRAWDTELQLA